jgi:hypothetical protein
MVEEREKAKLGEMVAQPCARLTANTRARRCGTAGSTAAAAESQNPHLSLRTDATATQHRGAHRLYRGQYLTARTRVRRAPVPLGKGDQTQQQENAPRPRARFSWLLFRADLVPQTEQVVIGIRRRQRASSTRPCRSGRPGTSVSSTDGSCGADEREKLYPAALRAALTQLRPRRRERPCRSQHLPPATRVNHPLLLLGT